MAAEVSFRSCHHFRLNGYCYNRGNCTIGTHRDCMSNRPRNCGCGNRDPTVELDVFKWIGGFKFHQRKFSDNIIINTEAVLKLNGRVTPIALLNLTEAEWNAMCFDPRVDISRIVIMWNNGMKELIDTLKPELNDHRFSNSRGYATLLSSAAQENDDEYFVSEHRFSTSRQFLMAESYHRGGGRLSNQPLSAESYRRNVGRSSSQPLSAESYRRNVAAPAAASSMSYRPDIAAVAAAGSMSYRHDVDAPAASSYRMAQAIESIDDDYNDMPALTDENSLSNIYISNPVENVIDYFNINHDYNHAIEMLPFCEIGSTPINCAVCQEESIAGDIFMTLPCFHRFHKDCITPWITQNPTCPTCKHNIRSHNNSEEVDDFEEVD